ncbi:MAG: SDR family NAD(P)-dependent oxidoreductase [Bacteroidales bacterium]|nr:SDR family NAD(P)-dependent oxidoreductase [Bacteroidales bacterium]
MKQLKDLIDISRFYGSDKDFTLAGGGNTSYKDEKYIWVKASGASLATITEDGFAKLYREKVKITGEKQYSEDEHVRERQVKKDLIAANVHPEKGKRPSVETSFHELINYAFVVHMHPTFTNALMCARDSEQVTRRLFGDEVLYIGYAPGYSLFLKVKGAVSGYRKKFKHDPKIIFLENHGVFVSADTTAEIREMYTFLTDRIKSEISFLEAFAPLPEEKELDGILPYIRMKLSEDSSKVLSFRHSTLHRHFYDDGEQFGKVSKPFTPDIIVYCKSSYLYIEETSNREKLIASIDKKLDDFKRKHGCFPRIIVLKDFGLLSVEDNKESAEIALDVYEDLMKISFYSEAFGGPRFMSDTEIEFIDNWEVENYRRKISRGTASGNSIDQRIVVVTGGAQGFGEGIATDLVSRGANVVIADINDKMGKATTERLSQNCAKNRVFFKKTDVSDPGSLEELVHETVIKFGGIDVFISNAGILYAGGIDELSPAEFDKMTSVNYHAWYYCVRAAAPVMKIQSAAKPGYTMDMIQINSKSGLAGSNRNFAYSGAKFGGIGLTQSFALELAPHGIKVNAVCPGNFFEGPLWADPRKGLFVQYLNAGKVPGAKILEDVKRHYEEKVPMKRGCRVEDVMNAIYYVIDQQYETGQAIPVTGGQLMLS